MKRPNRLMLIAGIALAAPTLHQLVDTYGVLPPAPTTAR